MTKFKHKQPILGKRQRSNLIKLASYLLSLPLKAKFHMGAYSQHDYDARVNDCGTVGCAVGHGPYAGIHKTKNEDFHLYSLKKFINVMDKRRGSVNGDAWSWCFSGDWKHTDNTAKGAAKRINYMLKHGVPNNSNAQKYGRLELSY